MPVVEYPSGTPFPGVIGRTTDESSPAWPAPARADRGHANVLFVVLDDTGFGQLGCYGSPIATPTFDALAADGLRYNNMHTTALCSPSRSCILTGRNHHSNGMAAITELATGLPRLQRGHPVRERLPVRDAARPRLQHVHGRQVAPDAEQPGDRRRAVRPLAARRGASSASTGSSAATPASGIPTSSTTTTRSSRRATPEEGYHLTEDLVDKSIEFIADAKQVDPDKPFYLHLCFGATHAPHHAPKEWADRYAGAVRRRLGRLPRAGLRPAEGARASSPPTPSCPATTPTCPTGTRCRRARAAVQPDDGGVRRLPQPHRPPPRPAARLPARAGGELDNTIVMVISDNGASAEGGPTGTTNEAQFFNNAQEPLEDSLAADRRDRRPEALQPLPVGLDLGRQHAVPALEARDLPRRRHRPVHRPLAGRDQGPRRGAHAVRAHHRHGADRARPARHRAAADDPRRHPVAAPGRELRAHASTTPTAPSQHHTQYFEMLGHRAIYHDGWRAVCPWPGPVVRRGRGRLRPADLAPRQLSELDASGWELYHVEEDFAENHDVADRAPRQAHRADRAPGTPRPASTACCRSTAAAWRA